MQQAHPNPCAKFMEHGLDERVGCRMGWKCKDYHPYVCRNSLHKRVSDKIGCRFPHIKGTKLASDLTKYEISHRGMEKPSTSEAVPSTQEINRPKVPQANSSQNNKNWANGEHS